MYLHRIIPVPFSADPDWAATQVVPPATVLDTANTAVTGKPVGCSTEGGRIYWWVIPHTDEDPLVGVPVDGTGGTFEARMVYPADRTFTGAVPQKFVGSRKGPHEVEGKPIPLGREIIDYAPPRGVSGTIQMISAAGLPGGVNALYIFWSEERRSSGG